jgi:quercetin dioxygenase-like cupin family protein
MLAYLLVACASEQGLPPAVVGPAELVPRDAPSGLARIWPLARGENAFVGRRELEPGASIPPHRDATEEYVVVLAGHGTVTIDGVETPVGPGATVYMPAGLEVSYANGVERMVAIQVFAGPKPADRYDDWNPVIAEPTTGLVREGPFTVACAGSECAVEHAGAAVAGVWHYGDPSGVLAPLDLLGFPDTWLVRAHAGDGCPVVFRALCLLDGRPVVTDPFGNCEDPSSFAVVADRVEIGFPGDVRPVQRVSLDPRTCGLRRD